MRPFTEKYRLLANVYCKLALTRTRSLLHMCYKLVTNILMLMFLLTVLSYSKCVCKCAANKHKHLDASAMFLQTSYIPANLLQYLQEGCR